MRQCRLFFLFLTSAIAVCYMAPICAEESITPQQELDHMNSELKQLNDLKNRYKASATRNEDDGIRWQFMQDYKQEAKQAFQRADMEREMVKQIQVRIDFLNQKKAELLKKNPKLVGLHAHLLQ